MKFRFCGNADAPDWLLAEMFTVSKLSSVRVRLLAAQLIQALVNTDDCEEFKLLKQQRTDSNDETDADEKKPSNSAGGGIDYDKFRKLIDGDAFKASDVEAVVSGLQYVITNATRYDVDELTLGRELEQLGLPKEHVEAVCKAYWKERVGLRKAMGLRTIKVNALRDMAWGVTFSSGEESSGGVKDGLGIRLRLDTVEHGNLDVEVSEEKLRVLLGELKAVKALMDADK
jgi:hypothetical protein